jgi:hypothetical protein
MDNSDKFSRLVESALIRSNPASFRTSVKKDLSSAIERLERIMH